jgi:hypothetical protein
MTMTTESPATHDALGEELLCRLAEERAELRRAEASGDDVQALISLGRIHDLLGLAERNDVAVPAA